MKKLNNSGSFESRMAVERERESFSSTHGKNECNVEQTDSSDVSCTIPFESANSCWKRCSAPYYNIDEYG